MRWNARLVLAGDALLELGESRPAVCEEEVATAIELEWQIGVEPRGQLAVDAERLARELTADPRAPLLAHAAGLDARRLGRDTRSFEHERREACFGELERDREARHTGADDHDVARGAHVRFCPKHALCCTRSTLLLGIAVSRMCT
jgi:hypothetical protein